MKRLKQTILTVTLIIGGLSLFVVSTPVDVSALTKDEIQSCFNQYNGKSLTAAEATQFQNNKCYDPGTACSVTSERVGGQTLRTVNCVNPSQGGEEFKPGTSVNCSVLPQSICDSADEGELEKSGIWRLLLFVINILTVGVGIVAVAAIIYAGFLYSSAGSDANQTKKAIEMIRNTAVGIITYGLMYAGANFLIPGGIFSYNSNQSTHIAQVKDISI